MSNSSEGKVICSSCGAENSPDAYFCRKCGIGIELLLPPNSTKLINVRVGRLFKGSIIGGLFGILITLLLSSIGTKIAAGMNWSIDAYKSVAFSYFVWYLGPLLFAIFSAIWLNLTAKKMGLPHSFLRIFLGAFVGVILAYLITLWSGKLGFVALFFLCPFLSARIGLGFMAPWWPAKKLILWGTIIGGGSILVFLADKFILTPSKYQLPPPDAIVAMAIDSENQNRLIAGNNKGDIFEADIKAKIIRHLNKISTSGITEIILPEKTEYGLAATLDEGLIYFSRSDGKKLSQKFQAEQIQAITASLDASKIIASTRKNLYISTDKGNSWGEVKGWKSNENEASNILVTKMGIDPLDENHFYLGIFGIGLMETFDNGLTIKKTSLQGIIGDLVIDPKSKYLAASTPAGVFITGLDQRWERIKGIPTKYKVRSLLFRQKSSLELLIITNYGLYKAIEPFKDNPQILSRENSLWKLISLPADEHSLLAGGNKGIMISSNDGASWHIFSFSE